MQYHYDYISILCSLQVLASILRTSPFIVERGVLRFSDGGYDLRWHEKAAAAPAARETHGSRGPRIVKKKIVGSFGPNSNVQTEGSIMDPCYDTLQ